MSASTRPPCPRRPDPPGHPRAARAGRGDGQGAGSALRHLAARRLPSPQGAGAGRPDRARPRGHPRPCRLAPQGLAPLDAWLVGPPHAPRAQLRTASTTSSPRTTPQQETRRHDPHRRTHLAHHPRHHAPLQGPARAGLRGPCRARADPALVLRLRRLADARLHQRRPARAASFAGSGPTTRAPASTATGTYESVEPPRDGRPGRIVHVERMHLPDPTPDNHIETTFAPDGDGHAPDPGHADGHRPRRWTR